MVWKKRKRQQFMILERLKERKKEKVNSINIGVNILILRQKERVIKWFYNAEYLVVELKMNFNWKQIDGINIISIEKVVVQIQRFRILNMVVLFLFCIVNVI